MMMKKKILDLNVENIKQMQNGKEAIIKAPNGSGSGLAQMF